MAESEKHILAEWEEKVKKQSLKVELFARVLALLKRKKAEKDVGNILDI